MKTIALIPARSGSKRVPGKNIRELGGHPLIAYAIQAAIDAEIFSGIYVSSDSWDIGRIAISYGAVFIERPSDLALDTSPDSDWIDHAQELLDPFDAFAIIRPTNPFRTGETIQRAWGQWNKKHIMKAVEPISQHPDKMWEIRSPGEMINYNGSDGHLKPTQSLRKLCIQNASLEFRTVAGSHHYQPFFTEGYEGHDINSPEDWILAETLIERGLAKLPTIRRFSI